MIATEEGYLRGGEQETDRDDKTITLEFEGKSEEDEFRGILFIPKRAPVPSRHSRFDSSA
jgi:hypothetical protein